VRTRPDQGVAAYMPDHLPMSFAISRPCTHRSVTGAPGRLAIYLRPIYAWSPHGTMRVAVPPLAWLTGA
jgi:hypothetical protein